MVQQLLARLREGRPTRQRQAVRPLLEMTIIAPCAWQICWRRGQRSRVPAALLLALGILPRGQKLVHALQDPNRAQAPPRVKVRQLE